MILISFNSFANDSEIELISGSWVVMKGEHPSVQMERETINIDVYKDVYNVEATFIFKNNGDSCTVHMGFPELGYYDFSCNTEKSDFGYFKTWIDGVPTEAKRELVQKMDDTLNGKQYDAYWVKKVVFKKNETKKVNVKYQCKIGICISQIGPYGKFLIYRFSGGNWYGKVLASDVNIYFHIPVEIDKKGSAGIQKNGDYYTYHKENWEAEEYFNVTFIIKDN